MHDEKKVLASRLRRKNEVEHQERLEQLKHDEDMHRRTKRLYAGDGFSLHDIVSFSNFGLVLKLIFMAMVVSLIYNGVMYAKQLRDLYFPEPSTTQQVGGALDSTANHFGVTRTEGLLYAWCVFAVIWFIGCFWLKSLPWYICQMLKLLMIASIAATWLPSPETLSLPAWIAKTFATVVGVPTFASVFASVFNWLGWTIPEIIMKYIVAACMAVVTTIFAYLAKWFNSMRGKPNTPDDGDESGAGSKKTPGGGSGGGGGNTSPNPSAITKATDKLKQAANKVERAIFDQSAAKVILNIAEAKLASATTNVLNAKGLAEKAVTEAAVLEARIKVKAAKAKADSADTAVKEAMENAEKSARGLTYAKTGASAFTEIAAVGAVIATLTALYASNQTPDEKHKGFDDVARGAKEGSTSKGQAKVIDDIVEEAKILNGTSTKTGSRKSHPKAKQNAKHFINKDGDLETTFYDDDEATKKKPEDDETAAAKELEEDVTEKQYAEKLKEAAEKSIPENIIKPKMNALEKDFEDTTRAAKREEGSSEVFNWRNIEIGAITSGIVATGYLLSPIGTAAAIATVGYVHSDVSVRDLIDLGVKHVQSVVVKEMVGRLPDVGTKLATKLMDFWRTPEATAIVEDETAIFEKMYAAERAAATATTRFMPNDFVSVAQLHQEIKLLNSRVGETVQILSHPVPKPLLHHPMMYELGS